GSSVRYASVFAAILVGSLAVLGLAGVLLLRLIRQLATHATVRRSAALRHGIGNLYRPGAHAAAILASLGVGVMFTVTVYFLQNSLLEEVRLTAPPDSPNLYLINITDRERDGLIQIFETESGILDRQPLSPAVQAQLTTIDGVPLER